MDILMRYDLVMLRSKKNLIQRIMGRASTKRPKRGCHLGNSGLPSIMHGVILHISSEYQPIGVLQNLKLPRQEEA
jgi:hypothetical protein